MGDHRGDAVRTITLALYLQVAAYIAALAHGLATMPAEAALEFYVFSKIGIYCLSLFVSLLVWLSGSLDDLGTHVSFRDMLHYLLTFRLFRGLYPRSLEDYYNNNKYNTESGSDDTVSDHKRDE